jgi:hypothetical protein
MSKILPIGPDMGSNTTTRNNSAAGCDDDLVNEQEARVEKLSTVGLHLRGGRGPTLFRDRASGPRGQSSRSSELDEVVG